MAETVIKTVENVDKLFPQIVVNGQTYDSDRYVPPEPSSVPATPQQSQDEETSVNPSPEPVQGQDVHAVELNNILHDIVDPVTVQNLETETRNRQDADQVLAGDIQLLDGRVSNIEAEIPSQASPSNQLADKNFVNSSISTNTANFLGTYTSLADIEAIPDPTNNDYVFLQTTDQAGNVVYKRYKYNGDDDEWLFEYDLNNSSFTAEQWATINSGLTSTSISEAINELDVSEVGGNGKYIKKISQINGKIVAEADWLTATGGGVAFIGTRAQYEVAKLIPLGQSGHIPDGALVIITDETDYIDSEDRTNA